MILVLILGRIPALKQEGFFEFEVSLSYRVRPSLKRKKFFRAAEMLIS